jgi:phospholipase/lecithinase/hemolysin
MQTVHRLRLLGAALATAAFLAACGGGGGTEPPHAAISRVIVAGDSLADVGAFGYKFTVQNSADLAAGFPIFPQIVAADFGVTGQCNFYVFTGGTFARNSQAGCTNYALGGGRVVNTAAQGGAASPLAVPTQLATALQVAGGTWTDSDLLLVDGGGNDAADLVTAYLGAQGNPAGFQAFLLQQLTPQELGAAASPEAAAGLYMHKLADTYYGAIKASALDHGATHVAVLNIPDITLTPKLQQVLAGVTAQAGATAAAQVKGALQQWISAFNTELKVQVGGDTRVALVDFYADITDQAAHPANYALANVTTPACPVTGVDGSGLPTYSFPACTSAALDAAPPAGAAAGWWQDYAFADSFHPTPYGHHLLAASVSRAIARAGWL